MKLAVWCAENPRTAAGKIVELQREVERMRKEIPDRPRGKHVDLFIQLRTSTRGNSRKHWRIDWQRTKLERETTRLAVLAERKNLPPFPVRVTLTRCGPRFLDRHNLPSALKAVIDGIADAYGIDDGHDGWQFVFDQKLQKTHGVAISIAQILS